ncbi:MAG: hypothetical protein JWM95_156, partial [Gemmatimonadetes bacterium]|nr:hypothetical protein [Gemmatimonadota bacterium]
VEGAREDFRSRLALEFPIGSCKRYESVAKWRCVLSPGGDVARLMLNDRLTFARAAALQQDARRARFRYGNCIRCAYPAGIGPPRELRGHARHVDLHSSPHGARGGHDSNSGHPLMGNAGGVAASDRRIGSRRGCLDGPDIRRGAGENSGLPGHSWRRQDHDVAQHGPVRTTIQE